MTAFIVFQSQLVSFSSDKVRTAGWDAGNKLSFDTRLSNLIILLFTKPFQFFHAFPAFQPLPLRRALDFQAKLYSYANALHNLVKGPCLRMAGWDLRNGSYVIAFRIALNDDIELAWHRMCPRVLS
jgi:hypothetical protein